MRIKLTDSVELAGKKEPAESEHTVDPATGRYLIAKKKAVEIPAEGAEPAPKPKTKTQTRRTRSKK